MQKEYLKGIYTLTRPEYGLPLVFDSPHSGALYPQDFDYACDFSALEKAEDKFVDELFAAAPDAMNGEAIRLNQLCGVRATACCI